MKKLLLLCAMSICCVTALAQNKDNKSKLQRTKAEHTSIWGLVCCRCIDSIEIGNKSNEVFSKEISKCIQGKVLAYQLSKKLMSVSDNPDKNIKIEINTNENSNEYKEDYYELERWVRDSCESLKTVVASHNKEGRKSYSENEKALQEYNKGIDKLKSDDFAGAIPYFKKAVEIDPDFAFCWDNLGVCYRNTGKYPEALQAYQKSLAIDPDGVTPSHNIPVVYEKMNNYQKALEAYLSLIPNNRDDPEGYFGSGRMYMMLEDNEKALTQLCKAYNLYVKMGSPYRTDAETLISYMYTIMKEKNQVKTFERILDEHHISIK